MKTAAYARYSSDNQRDASLDDQLRNCRAFAVKHGWPEPDIFTDAAISGSRLDRQAYSKLLANLANFDAIIVDDLSRLGRDNEEVARFMKRAKFENVRVIGVSDGVDTNQKGHKVNVGLRSLMNELYLDDLAEKTHRGLTGRALQGASAGGLPYGYRVTEVGERGIDEIQASVVRRIYDDYLLGHSPRQIADALNREGIPSARGSTWAWSAIRGDQKQGCGILANPIYMGRQIWNRSDWVKHPDTGRRIRKERPESDWIITDKPELAIVSTEVWDAAQARQRALSNRGFNPGRRPRYLFSGFLRCPQCGGPFVSVDRYRYGCSTFKDRGPSVCANRLRFPRADAEAALLAGIKEQLLTDEAFERFQHEVKVVLEQARTHDDTKARLAAAEREHENLMQAILAGIVTPSTKSRLVDLENRISALRAEMASAAQSEPAQLIPRLREIWRRIVASLEDYSRDQAAAREAIRELIGERIYVKEEGGDLVAEIAASSVHPDSEQPSQISMVAGAGFEPATFGL